MNSARRDLTHRCFQRQCRDIHVRLNELRTKRDSLQTEANDNVLVETSGLEEALKVCDGQHNLIRSNDVDLLV
jgi:hypothetical protein